MSKSITLRPRLNEKTYGLADSRVYVFDVERSVTKHSLARAVEAQFEVKVTKVNTTNIPGKAKRTISLTGKRMTNAEGSRSDFKKAYVTLAEGNALPFFDAIEEEEHKEEALQTKVDQAAAKQATKEAKKEAKQASKEAKKTDQAAPAEATKPAPKPKAAKTPAAKQPAEQPTQPDSTTAETEHHSRRPHLPAWRGFRMRKKSKNQDGDQ